MSKQAKFIKLEYPSKTTLLKHQAGYKYENTAKQIARMLAEGWIITAIAAQEQGVDLTVLERKIY